MSKNGRLEYIQTSGAYNCAQTQCTGSNAYLDHWSS